MMHEFKVGDEVEIISSGDEAGRPHFHPVGSIGRVYYVEERWIGVSVGIRNQALFPNCVRLTVIPLENE